MPLTFLLVMGVLAAVAILDIRATPPAEVTKVYSGDGRLVAGGTATAFAPGAASRIAAALVPAEITCTPNVEGGTTCTEPSLAPVTARASFWLRTLGMSAIAALLLSMLAGWVASRAIGNRVAPIAAGIDRAVREHDYSQRLPDAGALTTSINALIQQVQEGEVAIKRRSAEVESINKELEAFAYAVSHDLRAPLGSIDGFASALQEDWGPKLDENGRESLHWIRHAAGQMRELIDGLLEMSRLARAEMQQDDVDLSAIAHHVAETLKQRNPQRQVKFSIRDGLRVRGDERLLRAVLENLMSNAWKFTRDAGDNARIEFGVQQNGNEPAFYVRDNGAGFDSAHASKLFRPFQRLHSTREFEGTGIGLATVQKIVNRHGGKAWAEGEVGKGATIYFTTGAGHALHS